MTNMQSHHKRDEAARSYFPLRKLTRMRKFEPATPWRFFDLAESLRETLVFPDRRENRATLPGPVYAVICGPSRVIEMGIR